MKNSALSLTVLQISAVVASLLAIMQALLGFGVVQVRGLHGTLGNALFVVMLVAAVAAFLWSRTSHNKGLLMHAAGMAVLAIVQIGLGEMGQRSLHIAVGMLFLLGALALATLSFRKPGTGLDRASVDQARLGG